MTKKKEESIHPKPCPVCGIPTSYVYKIKDQYNRQSIWYRCNNGVIFQSEYPEYIKEGKELDAPVKTLEDVDPYTDVDLREVHSAHLYGNLIEDLSFGKFMLQVGFTTNPDILKFFEDRGWLVWGIDDRKFTPHKQAFKGDFINYNFDIDTSKKEIKQALGDVPNVERKFDLIWIEHYLERSPDPIGVLEKAKDLLTESGIIYLSVPDIGFINQRGMAGWGYWRKDTNYLFWSKRAITRELDKLGFEVIVCRRNFSSRTEQWDDLQVVAGRRYY